MRTGRLAISRGFSAPEPLGEPACFAIVHAVEAAPQKPEVPAEAAPAEALAAVHARLAALERLTRLCEMGALSIDEFLVEKAAILGHDPSCLSGSRAPNPAPVTFRPAEPRNVARGRSLAGRLGWMLIPLGLVAGLGLSAFSQPDATMRVVDEALRIIGA